MKAAKHRIPWCPPMDGSWPFSSPAQRTRRVSGMDCCCTGLTAKARDRNGDFEARDYILPWAGGRRMRPPVEYHGESGSDNVPEPDCCHRADQEPGIEGDDAAVCR